MLASRGRWVKIAYTPTPNTIKAVLSLFCGLAPEMSMAWDEFLKLNISECLPAVLKARGYDTAVFTAGALKDHVIGADAREKMGFDTTVGYEQLRGQAQAAGYAEVNYLGLEDDAVLPVFAAWLKDRAAPEAPKQRPFMAGMFTVTMHAPYTTPPA
eukprot:SAG22_NODE_11886_length_465_cov_0.734973_1_plen_155_part_11